VKAFRGLGGPAAAHLDLRQQKPGLGAIVCFTRFHKIQKPLPGRGQRLGFHPATRYPGNAISGSAATCPPAAREASSAAREALARPAWSKLFSYHVLQNGRRRILCRGIFESVQKQRGLVLFLHRLARQCPSEWIGRAPATGDLNGFAGAVENITFGFGGPGVIGYIDPNGQFGLGSFAFISVPEPSTFALILAGLLMMLLDRTMASRDSVIVDATFHPDGFTI
jgi:hypothetical protein